MMHFHKTFLSLILGFSLLGTGQIAHSASASRPSFHVPTAESLYDRSLSADEHYSYQGRQITTYWKSGHTVAVTVSHHAPDQRRLDYLAPERLEGMIFLSSGGQEWRYYPHSRLVRHQFLPPDTDAFHDAAAAYSLLKRNYLVTVGSKKQFLADRKTFLLTIAHHQGHVLARRLWIDAATGLVLKREIYQDNGRLAVTVAFSNISFHPHFSARSFSPTVFTKPGIRLVQEKSDVEVPIAIASAAHSLGTAWLAPHDLAGYELVGAAITHGKKTLLHLRYSDGLNLISLFEQRRTQTKVPTQVPASMYPLRIGPVLGHVVSHASLTAINWDTPVFNLTLIGETAQERLQQLVLILDDQKP